MLFSLSSFLSSSLLFTMPLMHCGHFINIPLNNNPESYLFLLQGWYLLVTYHIDLQGPTSWGKCSSLFWSVYLLSLQSLPMETDWEASYDTEIISFHIWLLETKQNVCYAPMTIFFNNLGFTFLFSIKLSFDITFSVLWELTFIWSPWQCC